MSRRLDKKSFLGLVFCFFLFLLVYGCAGGQGQKEIKDPFFDKWREMAEKSRGYSPAAKKRAPVIPEKKIEAVKEKKGAVEHEKPLPTQKTAIEMYDTDVVTVLRAMAKAVNQNIIINESVKGKININVKEAPWDQIFRGIMKSHGLAYAWEGDIIHIIDKDNAFKQLESEQKMKAKRQEIEMVEPLITRIVNVDYADAEKLKENLSQFLTQKSEGKPLGSVMVDEHSNSLIIQAIQGDIDKMLSLVDELDKPTPQILIEAQIVEATKTTARKLGVQWGGLYHDPGSDFWLAPGASGGVGVTPGTYEPTHPHPDTGLTVFPETGSFVNPSSGYAVNLPTAATTGLTLGLIAEEIGGSILALQLSALQNEGEVNILSSPSITTLDNMKATIESGKEVPYQTVEDGNVKIEFKKAVLKLEVTPHVINGKTIKMEIITTNDEVDTTVAANPPISTKKAETTVLLLDGQTTVIGGLSKEKADRAELGVPLLKDIPLLGWLFKSISRQNDMDEVLIFITPHILKEKVADISYPQPPEPETSPPDELSKVAPSEKPSFSVQAGTFVNKEDAYKLVIELKWKGYEPYIFESSDAMNQVVYAVRIGDYGNLSAALQSVSQLEHKNIHAVITHSDSLSVVENKSTQP